MIVGTNINPSGIFFSLGNSAISALAAMSAPALANVMTWLKANGITGIDMDCEGSLGPMDPACQTVTLAAIAADLALTAAPYDPGQLHHWQCWCAFVRDHGGAVSWLNVQCYAGGYGNNPVTGWATQFNPPVAVVAGFEALPGPDAGALSPDQAQAQLARWQAEAPASSLAGAFVWDFGLITSGTYTVSQFALAMYVGLTGPTATPVYSSLPSFVVPANTTAWGNFNIVGANILSAGVQNYGYLAGVYATQLFLKGAATLFYQIDNNNGYDIEIVLHLVTDGPFTGPSQSGTGSKPLT